MIRKISAHYVFPMSGAVVKYGIVVCHDDGEIQEVVNPGGRVREIASLEFYDGILIPGFVKAQEETDQKLFEFLMKMMQENPDMDLEESVRSITLDRAIRHNTASFCGSLDYGKYPGLYLISGIDFTGMKLKTESRLRILVPQGNPG
jgi:hypothetical protein